MGKGRESAGYPAHEHGVEPEDQEGTVGMRADYWVCIYLGKIVRGIDIESGVLISGLGHTTSRYNCR